MTTRGDLTNTVIDVLTKCGGYDPAAPHPSEIVLAAWLEHFEATDLTRSELLAAVAEHYSIPGVRTAQAADLSAIAYARRRADTETAERYAPRVFESPPDARIGRLAARKAVETILEAKGVTPRDPVPLEVDCDEWCKAPIGEPCVIAGTAIPLMRPPYYHPSRITKANLTSSDIVNAGRADA